MPHVRSYRKPTAMKIFLSVVTGEFKSYRLKLANQLGALKGEPFEIFVQENFRQGGDTLLAHLADLIGKCDVVIHLAGTASGYRPTAEHVRALYAHLSETPPDPIPDRSATQWEYQLAGILGKHVLVYVATETAPRDFTPEFTQSEQDAEIQREHLASLESSGQHYKRFSGHVNLIREIFYDLEINPELLKPNNLPFKSLGTLFKGRKEFLESIRSTLSQAEYRGHKRAAAITADAAAAAVYGLGGIGKTRAAIEYAHQHFDEYTALLFVRADSPEGLNANLAALCGPLVLDLKEQSETETEKQVAAALRWLQQHPGWFMIFDNVDTEAAAIAVEELLGKLSNHGQVVITSRLSRWSAAVDTLALDVLSLEDASAFLLERTEKRRRKKPNDVAQARTLAETLGQLALALEQAGAMIDANRYTFARYLEEWKRNHDSALAWFDERLMQYPKSVAVTWQTSFDQLTPPAQELLRLLAWFAPDPIPETILHIKVPDGNNDGAPLLTETVLEEALTDLERYSLVTKVNDTFSVHRLVQDVTRNSLVGDTDNRALTAALNWLNTAFESDPEEVRNWSTLDPLAPHAQACTLFSDAAGISDPTARLYDSLGILCYSQARYLEAEPLSRRALSIDEAKLGPDHPTVAIRINHLAQLLQNMNHLTEAEPLYRRALSINESSYGTGHPEVARSLSNLARLLHDTNRLSEAEQMFRRALSINESCFGSDHPTVAICLNNVAGLLNDANHLSEAEPLYRRALAIWEQSLGDSHPTLATGLNNLALLLQATDHLMEAEALYRRALSISERSLGTDHPNVARDLNNLATLLQITGRLTEAEPLYRRALTIDELRLGLDHPSVAVRLNNLARLMKATRRFSEAEPLSRRGVLILIKFTRDTGHTHQHLQRALDNYSGLLTEMGCTQKEIASTLYEMAPELYGDAEAEPVAG